MSSSQPASQVPLLDEGVHGVLEVEQVPDSLVEALNAILGVGHQPSERGPQTHQQQRVSPHHDPLVERAR